MHFWRLSWQEWRELPVSVYAAMVDWQNRWNTEQQKAHDEATQRAVT